ncbi:MAG TPA: adenylosuccinate lyase [Cyanobacteria bacterium UBA8530]|nr:adenylosuccinate lyase [Cyanobacteria bacterium UBA8530]
MKAISPLDGRYREKVKPLADFFSEAALHRYRVRVEIEYFIKLKKILGFPLENRDVLFLRAIFEDFSEADALSIREIERTTNHDLKAVEYFLKERIGTFDSLRSSIELVHLGLTSEDTNNLAYGCLLTDALHEVLLPKLAELLKALCTLAENSKGVAMLGRTHGQSASPTTLGKEIGVFIMRLAGQLSGLNSLRFAGKLTGATGTMGAQLIAYPSIDWLAFSKDFVEGLELEAVMVTTQIEPHDRLAEFCDRLRHVNNILLDLDQDLWRYISDGYFLQKVVEGEIGSSAMPHKVNPIDFENSEGNLGLSNSLLVFFSEKLTKSRLQRDLSDSTVQRNLGVAFGYSLLAYESTLKGLSRLLLDEKRIGADLEGRPEVLAEAYQTVLRAEGRALPYEKIKQLTRGKKITLEGWRAFLEEQVLEPSLKQRLLELTPASYVGYAPRLAELAVDNGREIIAKLEEKR